MSTRYRTLSVSSVRVITLPDDRRLQRAGARHYRAHTIRRSLLSGLVRASTAAGGWAWIAERDEEMNGLRIDDWSRELAAALGVGVRVCAVTWSRQPGRRAYLHLETDEDAPRALFGKVELRDAPAPLLAEDRALRQPWHGAPFRVPAPSFFGRLAGRPSLVMAGIPPRYRPHRLVSPAIVKDLLRSIGGPRDLATPTFPRRAEILNDPSLRRLLTSHPFLSRYLDEPRAVTLGRIHGDFTPANILSHGRDIVIVDWESSAMGAATATDHVSYIMARSKKLSLDTLVTRACLESPYYTPDDVRAALATMAFLGQEDRVRGLVERN